MTVSLVYGTETPHVHSHGLESSGTTCEMRNIAVVYLIDPESNGHNDEEHRQLDDDGEDEDETISSAHDQRGANPLEGLPSERLRS